MEVPKREKIEIIQDGKDATPKPMNENPQTGNAGNLIEVSLEKFSPIIGTKIENDGDGQNGDLDFDEITEILSDVKIEDIASGREIPSFTHEKSEIVNQSRNRKEFKIILSDSGNIENFDYRSEIEPKGTKEAESIEKFNEHYKYLTQGLGKIRPRREVETQTNFTFHKPKSIQSEHPKRVETGNSVKNYEIFDEISGYTENEPPKKINSVEELSKCRNFFEYSLIIERCLAENNFSAQMMRFKNYTKKNSRQKNSQLDLKLLWTFKCSDTSDLDVVAYDWSEDLLAVGYGHFTANSTSEISPGGAVLIWNYKNPVNPERKFKFPVSVCDVKFSKLNRQNLAVSFTDGCIQILDITEFNFSGNVKVIAKVDPEDKKVSAPILSMQWIQFKDQEFIFAASLDGRVIKYGIGSGGKLHGNLHVQILRVEGPVEGVPADHKKKIIESQRSASIFCLTRHPTKVNEFMIGTDEGCIYSCSSIFTNRIISHLQVQEKRIFSIEFSPFFPKLFLTAGMDFKIRIWIEGISEPLMEFGDKFSLFQCVKWSKIYPTIIVSCSLDGIKIWDLKQEAERPIIQHKFPNQLTIFEFSPSGTSIIVGDIQGNSHLLSIHEFPPRITSNRFAIREYKQIFHRTLKCREKLLERVMKMFKTQN